MNMGGKITTDLEIRKLKRLYKKGYSALEIAYNINRPVSFVKKYIKKIENKK
jgi:transposase